MVSQGGVQPGWGLRLAQIGDLFAVQQLDRLCRLAPWERGTYRDFLRRPTVRFSTLCRNCNGSPILGFCIASRIESEMEIFKIAIHPAFRLRGAGRQLLTDALQWGRDRGAKTCVLEVRSSSQGAIQFYQRSRFRVYGHREGYYSIPVEDALLMQRTLHPCHSD